MAKVRLARRSALRPAPVVPPRRLGRVDRAAPLRHHRDGGRAARLRDMHPSDVAAAVRALPLVQRRQLAEMLDDERLADLARGTPEAEQLRIIEGLDLQRLLGVLDEMEYDDLVDLLGEMPGEQRSRILEAMDEEDGVDAASVALARRGHRRQPHDARHHHPRPTATVAEALAEVRNPDWLVSIAAQIFVCQPPYKAPTGQYLASCTSSGCCASRPAWRSAVVSRRGVDSPDPSRGPGRRRLATYNLLAVPVCDDAGRLLGAITVDDVLDRVLPTGWRQRRSQTSRVGVFAGDRDRYGTRGGR